MGWEKRGHRLYYYRKRREGRRVVSEYVGAGPLSKAIAELDALDQGRRGYERERQRLALEEERAVDEELDRLDDLVGALTHAVLLANSYHTHKGQWRKRRHEGTDG